MKHKKNYEEIKMNRTTAHSTVPYNIHHLKVRKLEQVHAGGGSGQPLQVRPGARDAERRIQVLTRGLLKYTGKKQVLTRGFNKIHREITS